LSVASILQTVCNMCMYEFAEVDPYWPPAASWKRFPGSPSTHQPIFWSIAEAMPDALSWKPISDESGQNMLGLKKPKAHASTDRLCQDEQQAYLFGWSMPITCGDAHPAVIPMVKYIHCSRGHAILVRKASELEVEVATTGAMGWCKSLGYRDGMLARVKRESEVPFSSQLPSSHRVRLPFAQARNCRDSPTRRSAEGKVLNNGEDMQLVFNKLQKRIDQEHGCDARGNPMLEGVAGGWQYQLPAGSAATLSQCLLAGGWHCCRVVVFLEAVAAIGRHLKSELGTAELSGHSRHDSIRHRNDHGKQDRQPSTPLAKIISQVHEAACQDNCKSF